MKQNIILAMFILIGWTAQAQISGGFNTGTDIYGNKYVYFQGTNNSSYNININILCRNDNLDEERAFNFSPLYSGNSFTIGPANGWIWQPGEKLYITYPNGKSVYWVFQPRNNPSFKGHGACTHYDARTRVRCNCPGYKGGYGKGPCERCHHKYTEHN